MQQVVARNQREAWQQATTQSAEVLLALDFVVGDQHQSGSRRATHQAWKRGHHTAACNSHTGDELADSVGSLLALCVVALCQIQIHIEQQADVEVNPAFFDDAGRAAVLAYRVARQVKTTRVARARGLGLEAVADHADAVKLEPRRSGQFAFHGTHQADEGRNGREAPGHRACNGVGVLNAQAWQQQQRLAARGISSRHGCPPSRARRAAFEPDRASADTPGRPSARGRAAGR